MKVLCIYRPNGPATVSRGWENVFRACGHEFRYWNRAAESAFDVFNAFKPDLFIGTTWDADEALLKLCKKYPEMRVVLYAATWGPLSDEVPLSYPIVRVSPKEKVLLERMKRETGRPDLVWLHLTPSYVEPILGGYRSIGVTPAGITNAADLYAYCDRIVKPEDTQCWDRKPEYACDVAFVGGNWSYKGLNINPYLGPLLHPDHPAKLHVRVFGNQTWSHHNYLGLLAEGEAKHVFRSAKTCPSIGEPHSLIFSDIVERTYKVVAAGGLCVVGPEVGIEEEFGPGVIPCGKTPQEYQDLIVGYCRSAEVNRRILVSHQQQAIIAKHTYHDRITQLADILNLPTLSREVKESKKKYLASLAPQG